MSAFVPTPIPGGAAALTDQASSAYDQSFEQRIMLAIGYVAGEVQTEAPTTTNHANRIRLASEVLRIGKALAPGFAVAALSDLVTVGGSTDQQLVTRIEALWDQIAGIS